MSGALLLTLAWDVTWKRRGEGKIVPDRNWELGGREVGFPAWLCLSWLLSPSEGSRSGAGLAALQTLILTIQSWETSWQNRVCGEAGETGAEAVITRNPCRDWVISKTLPEFCLVSTLSRSQVSSRMSTSCPLAPCSSCLAGDRDTQNQIGCRVQRKWFVEENRPMSAHTGPSALNSPTGFYTGGQHSCVNHSQTWCPKDHVCPGFSGYVALGNLCHLTEPQFLQLWNEDLNNIYPK